MYSRQGTQKVIYTNVPENTVMTTDELITVDSSQVLQGSSPFTLNSPVNNTSQLWTPFLFVSNLEITDDYFEVNINAFNANNLLTLEGVYLCEFYFENVDHTSLLKPTVNNIILSPKLNVIKFIDYIADNTYKFICTNCKNTLVTIFCSKLNKTI